MTPQEQRLQARLEATDDRLRSMHEAERLEREIRDRVITEAIDSGCTYRQVATWTGLSRAQVGRILAAGDSW